MRRGEFVMISCASVLEALRAVHEEATNIILDGPQSNSKLLSRFLPSLPPSEEIFNYALPEDFLPILHSLP